MNVTTWDELSDEWIGRKVIVRWEDGSLPMAEGFPSGVPHEWSGVLVLDENCWVEIKLLLHDPNLGTYTSGFPAHALVQEVNE